MNAIDGSISLFFSSLASHHPGLNSFLLWVANSYFVKGQVMILLWWWVWFCPGTERHRRRQVLAAALLGCVFGLAIGRVMVSTLPLRLRPTDNPAFHFIAGPFSPNPTPETSFPSDHAILFVGLATGIFLASRRVGSLALAYVAIVICFPRLWLGFHFLTDLLAGALIGAGIVLLLNQDKVRSALARPLLSLVEAKPHFFYAGLLLFSYQVSEMFDPLRDTLTYLHHHGGPVIVSMIAR